MDTPKGIGFECSRLQTVQQVVFLQPRPARQHVIQVQPEIKRVDFHGGVGAVLHRQKVDSAD